VSKTKHEMWALHEKKGSEPWQLAQWFLPTYRTEEETRSLAKSMTTKNIKYKAVRYTPTWEEGR
jgi:hypothetical protein